jgi:hypothetical protein
LDRSVDPVKRSWRARGLIAAVVTLGALVVGTAHAEPTAVERETARTLLLSGRDKKKNGNLKGALADFEKAHRIMRVPTTGLDLGKAQKDLGLLVEARTTFLEAVHNPEKPNEPQAFKRARREAKQLADETAPRLGTLVINTSNGVTVKMDDVELSASSFGVPLKVNPGKHEIVATLNNEEKKQSIEVEEGGRPAPIELTFAGAAAAGQPKETTQPKETAQTPKKKTEEGSSPPTKTNSLVWVGIGTAAVGVGVGAVSGIMAFSAKSEVSSRCEGGTRCPPSTYADIDRGESLGTVSTIAFVVGGIGVGVMIYGLLNPTKTVAPVSTESTTGKLRWYPGPFGVSGRF